MWWGDDDDEMGLMERWILVPEHRLRAVVQSAAPLPRCGP